MNPFKQISGNRAGSSVTSAYFAGVKPGHGCYNNQMQGTAVRETGDPAVQKEDMMGLCCMLRDNAASLRASLMIIL